MTFVDPAMPDSKPIFQKMIDMFVTAGQIGIAIIGAAVALGILVVLAYWGWGLLRKWLAKAK
jgi:hypothetical protein